jgi:PBP1b-binding outer membrane lipoprotein LpoB
MILLGITLVLSACTTEPKATIRDIEKTDTQVTITLFLEDPNDTVERVDITLMDSATVLTSATNIKEADTLEGLWDVTLPMSEVEAGTYEIVVEARLSNDETIELTQETLEWP